MQPPAATCASTACLLPACLSGGPRASSLSSPPAPADYHTAQGTRIRMKWQTGAQAHDWQAVAKKDNLNAIQVGGWVLLWVGG